jgi:hypothetical protein
MPNNVQQYHVSGEAAISVGTGADGALEVLGISRDGVSIQIIQKERPIKSDVGGSESAVEYQRMGEEAFIDLTLVAWKEDILRKVRNRPFKLPNNAPFAPADGVAIPRGPLLGTGGGLFAVGIGAFYEDPWYFFNCKVFGQPQSVTVGTVNSEYKLRFHAFVFVPGDITSITGMATADYPRLFSHSLLNGGVLAG